MIQRIQTIYLLLAFVVTGVLLFFFPLWTMSDNKEYFFMQSQVYTILLGLSTSLTLLGVVSYKKRQNQFVIGRLNIILNLILLLEILRIQKLSLLQTISRVFKTILNWTIALKILMRKKRMPH